MHSRGNYSRPTSDLQMKKAFGFVLELLLLTVLLFAIAEGVHAELPNPPSDCFSRQNFCSSSQVTRDQEGRRVIRVTIFAKLDKSKYGQWQELKELYFDFAKWPDYASHSKNIDMIASEQRPSTDSRYFVEHYAKYYAKAPFPIGKMEVEDLVSYHEIASPSPNGVLSVEFLERPDFTARKGLKFNRGELHLLQNDQNWNVVFINDVIPSIDILPKVAAPYIERSMMDIFHGMFDF